MRQSEQLLQAIRGVMNQWPLPDLGDQATFIRNLVFLHRVILASESLLEFAVPRADGELRDYYADHLEEERRHDEWLALDLESVGVDVDAEPYPIEAVAAAGSQYYLVGHVDPCALLGYMAVLECFPMPVERLEQLEGIYGLPLCRTLRHHAMHDISHSADLLEQVDSLNEKQFQLVVQNAVQTALFIGSAISKFQRGAL